jgi:hypothetical protein
VTQREALCTEEGLATLNTHMSAKAGLLQVEFSRDLKAPGLNVPLNFCLYKLNSLVTYSA